MLLVLLSIFLPVSAFAAAPDPCVGADIVTIQRPIDPSNPSGQTFAYKFRYLKKADAGMPTVVFIPGGPGDTSIDDDFINDTPANLPAGFGLIRTDPRGVGCNQTIPLFPQVYLGSEFLASDILAIVNTTHLDHYYLHGISYGTLLATMIAGKAEKGTAKVPDAVILEGVLGRAFRPMEVFDGFLNRWEQVKAKSSLSVNEIMASDPTPLQISAQNWGLALPPLLILGVNPLSGQDIIIQLLSGLDPSSPQSIKSALSQTITNIAMNSTNTRPEKQALYQEIVCRELASEVFSSLSDIHLDYSLGTLAPAPGNLCDGIALDRPFDSSHWLTSAPIYYFEGSDDPSTPMPQALFHFNSQGRSVRTFVRVNQGAHVALNYNLSDCKVAILAEIAKGGKGLEGVLKGCHLSTDVIRSP